MGERKGGRSPTWSIQMEDMMKKSSTKHAPKGRMPPRHRQTQSQDRQTDRQIDRHTDRHTVSQTDRHTNTDRQTTGGARE